MKLQRVQREFAVKRVREAVRGSQLVAVAHTGHLPIATRSRVIKAMEDVGGQAVFAKNSLIGIGLKEEGAEALTPLLRGKLALTTGPAEVPLAKKLVELTKEIPDFFVLGAVINSQQLLQVRTLPHVATETNSDVRAGAVSHACDALVHSMTKSSGSLSFHHWRSSKRRCSAPLASNGSHLDSS